MVRLTRASLCLPNFANTSACSLYLGLAKLFLDGSLTARVWQAVREVESRVTHGEQTLAWYSKAAKE